VTLRPGGPNPGLDLALALGGNALRGTVSDVSGGLIEGVVVSVERSDDGSPLDFSRAPAPTLTDAAGRYALQVESGSRPSLVSAAATNASRGRAGHPASPRAKAG